MKVTIPRGRSRLEERDASRTAYILTAGKVIPIRTATGKAGPAIRLIGAPTGIAFFQP